MTSDGEREPMHDDAEDEIHRLLYGDPSKPAPRGVIAARGESVPESCDNPFGRSAAKRREVDHGRA